MVKNKKERKKGNTSRGKIHGWGGRSVFGKPNQKTKPIFYSERDLLDLDKFLCVCVF